MNAFQGKTCAAKIVGGYCIVVHGTEPPSDDEWTKLVEVETGSPRDGVVRLLVSSEGGAPNPRQRALLNARASHFKMIAAVLTPSVLARAAAMAIRWFQPNVLILAPHELEKGMDHIGVLATDRELVRSALREMRAALQQSNVRAAAPN